MLEVCHMVPRRPRFNVWCFPHGVETPRSEAQRSMALQSEIWGMLTARYRPTRKCNVFVESGLVVGVQHNECVEPC